MRISRYESGENVLNDTLIYNLARKKLKNAGLMQLLTVAIIESELSFFDPIFQRTNVEFEEV